MKGLFLLPLAAAVLAGCQGSDAPATEITPPAAPKKVVQVGEPKSIDPNGERTESNRIGLVVRKGPPVTVDYPYPDKIFDSFKDSRYSGSEYDDLPPTFGAHYRARIWETAHSGFGEIIYDGHLVGAMYQEDKVTQDRVDEIVAAHRAQVDYLLPVIISGKRVTYWFWKIDDQRLMICAYQTGKQGIKLTVAMGDVVVMDALGISAQLAQKDIAKIDAASSKPLVAAARADKPQD